MKRSRVPTADDEPLSKRINNLHLDNYGGHLSQNQIAYAAEPSTSRVQGEIDMNNSCTNVFPQKNNDHMNGQINSQMNGHMNGNSSSAIAAHNICTVNSGGMNYHGINDEMVLQQMIERRELPESLNICYPNLNPSVNDNYFSFNKKLHSLHLERLKRLGKLT